MAKKKLLVEHGSPWARFLGARAEMIRQMMADGDDAAAIARSLSCDVTQVRLIGATPLADIVETAEWHKKRLAERG